MRTRTRGTYRRSGSGRDGHPLWGLYLHRHVLKAHTHEGSAAQHVLPDECLDVVVDVGVSVAGSSLPPIVWLVSFVWMWYVRCDDPQGFEEPDACGQPQGVLEDVRAECGGTAKAREEHLDLWREDAVCVSLPVVSLSSPFLGGGHVDAADGRGGFPAACVGVVDVDRAGLARAEEAPPVSCWCACRPWRPWRPWRWWRP